MSEANRNTAQQGMIDLMFEVATVRATNIVRGTGALVLDGSIAKRIRTDFTDCMKLMGDDPQRFRCDHLPLPDVAYGFANDPGCLRCRDCASKVMPQHADGGCNGCGRASGERLPVLVQHGCIIIFAAVCGRCGTLEAIEMLRDDIVNDDGDSGRPCGCGSVHP